ncbi:MAG: hypothetical protein H6742_04105 [Alphaproteobacteria bacterium]|nr:hypothetical protein [Alphaproteobacteria bacterium]
MTLLLLLPLLGCKDKATGTDSGGDSGEVDGVLAIVDPARGEHYFDVPFPSDTLLGEGGHADLTGFPTSESASLGPVIAGWVSRVEATTVGFANNGASYFRFEEALSGLPTETTGSVEDPVLWVSLTGDPELLPLVVQFVDDPHGDPFWGENTLAFGPAIGSPPRSGGTYAAVVMQSAGVRAPAGYSLPDGVQAALDAAGVAGAPAVATVFTVQDVTGQLRALADDVDTRLGGTPDWSSVEFKRVTSMAYAPGTTPSGEEATVLTVTFEDGTTELSYQGPGGTEHGHDFDESWPMAVYEAYLPTLNYSGLDDRPYMSPGFAHIADTGRTTGWIQFEGDTLTSTPDDEPMRIVVSLPKDGDGNPRTDVPVVLWDHGTGGHAYNYIQRITSPDRGDDIAALYADAGFAVIGRDAPLYGTRFPLIDEGYDDSLGFYNVVNTPAFRDNQRQTAVDGHVLLRFVQTGLNDALPAGGVDPTRVRRAGHSLGSVTANLGHVMDGEFVGGEGDGPYEAVFLSGSGGVFIHYFLDTGLLDGIDPSLISSIFALFGAEAPDEVTTRSLLGAGLGLDEAAWANIGRLHPIGLLFQWQMDPSDPMAVARDGHPGADMIIGIGDLQVPNFTSYALLNALPDATGTDCVPTVATYDPHSCLFREDAGLAILEDWLAE